MFFGPKQHQPPYAEWALSLLPVYFLSPLRTRPGLGFLPSLEREWRGRWW